MFLSVCYQLVSCLFRIKEALFLPFLCAFSVIWIWSCPFFREEFWILVFLSWVILVCGTISLQCGKASRMNGYAFSFHVTTGFAY